MCDELQKILKLDQDLTDTKVQIASNYHHYKWEMNIKDPEIFKRALAKYRKSHPDIDIISEDVYRGPTFQYALYVLGIIGALASIIAIFA